MTTAGARATLTGEDGSAEQPQLRPIERHRNPSYHQHQDVIVISQLRLLPYDQRFTIVGGRNKRTGEEARTDVTQRQQIVKQVRLQLEELMKVLRRLPPQHV